MVGLGVETCREWELSKGLGRVVEGEVGTEQGRPGQGRAGPSGAGQDSKVLGKTGQRQGNVHSDSRFIYSL